MLPDPAFHLFEPKAVEGLYQSALDGMARVLAEKLNEFTDANPGVKPDHFQLHDMLKVALDDAVFAGRREHAVSARGARAALLLLLSASNISTQIFDAARPSLTEDRMLSTENVAQILNVSRPYVVKLADSGKLGAIEKTEGGQRRIPAAAVEAYRSERQAKSRKALEDLAATSEEGRLYDATAGQIDGKDEAT
ncbi:helix-turn-helix domain-containing protein [Paraburkholderia aspalathi]|uniref:DNA binding domain-containing protein, excisionase family n=1 Tax=Paraburkholderia aspalathi TaxID=1324617 RepID=A0A1I7ENM8_9BURK|nr:helix-turn-helix domain-containing protein [Paraburkholderia aspalathi]SFU25530.1 DNA binding domain-containing protein, excisionase family [Paraburkholderia aspalathi]